MPGNHNTIVAERKQRWTEFLSRDKPPSHLLLVRLNENAASRPLPHPDNKQARIEWAWQQYLRQRERIEWLDDDALPYLDIYTGTEIFAEAFGCKVHRPDDQMPFALPLITKATQAAQLDTPSIDTPGLRLLFDIADELRERAGAGAVLRMVDIQSPMDIAALIWQKATFYVALVEEPEAVGEVAAKAKQLLTTFLDEWFSRYGLDFVAHYPDYYMPKGITLSEDEIGSVGADVYHHRFHPELAELSQRYGGIGIHCCANARHQWEGLKRIPNLRLLNLVQPPEILREAYQYFGAHTAQMHSWRPEEDPWAFLARLPPESRVVLQVNADSKQQAIEFCSRIRPRLTNRRQI
ncbi:MAG: hypothetical protein HYV35_08345 [Lentisphaerae bacterium]|nr:hypothetical protein [Lentisphaerota bacterium]